MKYFIPFIFVLLIAASNSCDLEGECYTQTEVPVIRFEMPDSIAVDSNIAVKVVYVTYSNCSRLNNLNNHLSGDTISVHVISDYEGCECPDIKPDSVAVFNFKSKVERTYIFRALASSGIIEDTLIVYDTDK